MLPGTPPSSLLRELEQARSGTIWPDINAVSLDQIRGADQEYLRYLARALEYRDVPMEVLFRGLTVGVRTAWEHPRMAEVLMYPHTLLELPVVAEYGMPFYALYVGACNAYDLRHEYGCAITDIDVVLANIPKCLHAFVLWVYTGMNIVSNFVQYG